MELIIVLTIFVFIIIVTTGILISAVQRQRSLLGEQELSNQVSYIMEVMFRKIRTAVKDNNGSCLGNNFVNAYYLLTHLDGDSGFYRGIKFVGDDSNCYEFFLGEDNTIKQIQNQLSPKKILSSKFQINYLRILLNGNKALQSVSASDSVQPRVTVVLSVQILAQDDSQQERIFQTTISQRNLENF